MTAEDSIPMLDVILPQVGRIYRLILQACPRSFSSLLSEFSTPGRSLSSLTEASFSVDRLEIPDGGIYILGDRPLLCKLHICLGGRRPDLLNAIRSLGISFPQLTELSLNTCSSPHAMLCILKGTPNLIRFSIRFAQLGPNDDPAFDIVHPHLKILKLLSYAPEELIGVLRHVTLPSLLELYVSCPTIQARRAPNVLPSEVLPLINRSSCNLTHLRLDGNIGPIVEQSHSSLVSFGTLLSAFPASMVQRIIRRDVTLRHTSDNWLVCLISTLSRI